MNSLLESLIGSCMMISLMLAIIFASFSASDIKVKESDLYSALGEPHFWYPNTAGFAFIFGFILLGEYRWRVKDKRLKRWCDIQRVNVATLLFLVVSFIGSTFVVL